jgi:hypothetical protein
MIHVGSLPERKALERTQDVVLVRSTGDGGWDCYFEGDELPALPDPGPETAARLVDPIAVPRAFVAALGPDAGKIAWAKIRASVHPDCVYWMSELALIRSVDVDYPSLPAALARLLTIDGGDGQPILAEGQPEAVLAALQGMAGS